MLAVVGSFAAPMYSYPMQGILIDEVLFGMTVEVNRRKNGYCFVKTSYQYTGWVPEACLYFCDAKKWRTNAVVMVNVSATDILSQPYVKADKMAVVPKGGLLWVMERRQHWSKVRMPNGNYGWITNRHLQFSDKLPNPCHESHFRKALCETAMSYLGTSYRWGGKTCMGIDCSGLVSMAYLLNGITIYRDAKLKDGFAMHPIPIDLIKPADLIYFPNHVAMYLGEQCFVHSTASEMGCCVQSFLPNEKNYRRDLEKNILCAGSIF